MPNQLDQLVTQAIDCLKDFIENSTDANQEAIDETIWEIADYETPIANHAILMLAANNLTTIGLRNIPDGILSDINPAYVAQVAIFEYLKEALYQELPRLQER